ncbi:MAG: hypothetical protein QM758_12045 [Armatimonas sp.]
MTRRNALTLGLTGLVSATAWARQTEKTPKNKRILASDGQMYQLGATEQVSAPGTSVLGVAPKGRYLLSVYDKRATPAPRRKGAYIPPLRILSLWDTKLRRAKTLWRYQETAESQIYTPHLRAWLSPTVALLEYDYATHATESVMLVVNCGTGTVSTVPLLSGYQTLHVNINPTQPSVFVCRVSEAESEQKKEILLIGASGLMKQRVISGGVSLIGWSRDGKRFYASRSEKTQSGDGYRERWFTLDSNLQETPLQNAPNDIAVFAAREPEPELSLQCIERTATLTVDSVKESLSSLWLSTSEEGAEIRVAAEIDADSGILMPDLSAVAYQYQRALYVTPLTKLE